MSNITIPELPVAVGLDGTEQIEIVQPAGSGGTSKRTTVSEIANTATGFVPTSRRVNTDIGLTGGGALTADLDLSLNINDLSPKAPMAVDDSFAVNDVAGGNVPKKITFTGALNAVAALTHKALPAAADRMPVYSIADSDSRYSTVSELLASAGSLPTGGTIGQPLIKNSSTNYDTSFATLPVIGGGTGQVTLTNHGILLGQGTSGVAATAAMTNGQLLIGQTAADPLPTTVTGDVTITNAGVTAIGPNKVTDAMLRQSTGLSVVGRSASSTGNVADVTGTANQVLRVNGAGTTLGFGSIDLAQSATVGTSILDETNGGTGLSSYTLGDTVYASATNTLSKLAGNTTSGIQYLSQTGTGAVSAAPAWNTIAGGDITGAALTKVDDTNVTLTLGGTPTTALLRAASITAGWTGQLGLTRGGTNASLTASNGGIFYSTASAGAILAGTATARQMLQSGATAAPAWSTTTWPATTTVNRLLWSSAANVISDLATTNGGIVNASAAGVPSLTVTPVLGVAGTSTGTIGLSGITSGVVTITPQAAAGTATFTLPNASGTPAISVPSPLSLSATTGAASWAGLTSGGVLYASGTTSVASSALLTANAIVLGGGAGAAPSALGSLGTTTTVLHGNAAGAPTFGAVSLTADVSGVLPGPNGGTGLSTAAIGDLIYASATTPTWSRLADVAVGSVLVSGGANTAPAWSSSPTITTSLTTPLLIGGTTASSSLTLESTSGVGTTDFMSFATGSQVERMRISSGGVVGIGNNLSGINGSALVVNKNTATVPVQTVGGTQPVITMVHADSSISGFSGYTFGTQGPQYNMYMAGGTGATPTATASGTSGAYVWQGYANGTYRSGAVIFGTASEAWTNTANGMYVSVFTTPTTTTAIAEAARFQPSGGFSVGTTADSGIGTLLLKKQTFASLTAASSTIEGAMASVTDSTTNVWGATITGGGANHVLAYCNGTNWTVMGK